MTLTGTDVVALATILKAIFYGAYIVIFVLYLVLWRRRNRTVDRPLTLAHVLLFGLCTISICLDIPAGYFDVVPDVVNKDTAAKLQAGSMVVFSIVDYLAQMILLYRCWIIWDRRWVVVAVPGLLALVTLGGVVALVGLIGSPFRRNDPGKFFRLYAFAGTVVFSISLIVNALTTSLLVTKIFLLSREMRPHSGSNSHRPFRVVTAMLVESGLIILAFQLVFVILFSIQHPAVGLISGPITHIYGITPTLLNIRVVMGSAHDKTTEKVSSLKFSHPPQTAGPSMSVAGVQSQIIDIEPNEVSDNERATGNSV